MRKIMKISRLGFAKYVLLFLLVPAALAQRVLPSEPAPFPAEVAAVGVILTIFVILLIITHAKK